MKCNDTPAHHQYTYCIHIYFECEAKGNLISKGRKQLDNVVLVKLQLELICRRNGLERNR